MKCLSPIVVINPKYRKAWENGFDFVVPVDDFQLQVPCGRCYACLKKRSSDWRVRLLHESIYGKHKSANWVTLTIAPEFYDRFVYEPQKAIRLFLDRVRKKTGRSVRHWFITELGEENNRLHFHGFVWDLKFTYQDFRDCWKYGHVWISYVSNKRISYACKYSMKLNSSADWFYPRVFCSPGLGRDYVENPLSISFHVRDLAQNDRYYLKIGLCYYGLPIYYRNRLFSEERRKARKKYLEDNPPPFREELLGITYTDPRKYQEAREFLYKETKLLRASFVKPVWSSKPNLNFVID